MNKADYYMQEDIKNILNNGYLDVNPRPKYKDGTPAHTMSVNHVVRKYDLSKGEFPITSLRPIAWKSAIKEIFWIYQDKSNDLNILRNKYNIHYWDEWESIEMPNTIGTRYGEVVRRYDLIHQLLDGLKNNPYGRRHIIDLYQYRELNETDGLFPCAFLTIWNVRNNNQGKEYLDMCLIQRSGDMLTASGAGGINEVQYAALMMMVARHCGYEVGVFTHFVCNEQIYDRHKEQASEMLNRATQLFTKHKNALILLLTSIRYNSLTQDEQSEELDNLNKSVTPRLILNSKKVNFHNFTIDDFTMENYEPIKPNMKFDLGI